MFPFVEAESGDQEGFGLVMVEAMGCGCLVVASELPAVRDVIRPGETGFFATSRDIRSLSDALIKTLVDQDGMQSVATRGLEHAIRSFDWEVTAGRFAETLKAELQGERAVHLPSHQAES